MRSRVTALFLGVVLAIAGTAIAQLGGPSSGLKGAPPGVITQSGTFSAIFSDACTTDYTITMDYQRVGNMVALTFTNQPAACTGDSIFFRTAAQPVPAAIRPSHEAQGPIYYGFNNNAVQTGACIRVETDGDISFFRWDGTTCGLAGWTSSGNRSGPIPAAMFTYMLGNP